MLVLHLKTTASVVSDETALSSRFSSEAILVDFQRPNLRFQRGPRYAQLGRGPRGSEHAPAAFFQGSLNHVHLFRLESSGELNLVSRSCRKRLLW